MKLNQTIIKNSRLIKLKMRLHNNFSTNSNKANQIGNNYIRKFSSLSYISCAFFPKDLEFTNTPSYTYISIGISVLEHQIHTTIGNYLSSNHKKTGKNYGNFWQVFFTF